MRRGRKIGRGTKTGKVTQREKGREREGGERETGIAEGQEIVGTQGRRHLESEVQQEYREGLKQKGSKDM